MTRLTQADRERNWAAWERIFATLPPHRPHARDDEVAEPLDDDEVLSEAECVGRAADEVWHG